jgi:hypothetical protein
MPFLCLDARKPSARMLGTSAHVSLFHTTVNTKLRHYRVVELLPEMKFTLIHGVIPKLVAMCMVTNTNNAPLPHSDVFKWNKCRLSSESTWSCLCAYTLFHENKCENEGKYSHTNLVLDRDRSTLWPLFSLKKIFPCIQWLGTWIGQRDCMDEVKKWTITAPVGN